MALAFEQQPKESDKAFAAFSVYLSQGPGRPLAKTAAKLGKSKAMMEKWSSKFDWPTPVGRFRRKRHSQPSAPQVARFRRKRHPFPLSTLNPLCALSPKGPPLPTLNSTFLSARSTLL
jgi:hypothetical protein